MFSQTEPRLLKLSLLDPKQLAEQKHCERDEL